MSFRPRLNTVKTLLNHSLLSFIKSSMFSPSFGVSSARLFPKYLTSKFFTQLVKVQIYIELTNIIIFHPRQDMMLCFNNKSLPLLLFFSFNYINKGLFPLFSTQTSFLLFFPFISGPSKCSLPMSLGLSVCRVLESLLSALLGSSSCLQYFKMFTKSFMFPV